MKTKELRAKSLSELQELEENLRLEQFNLRMQRATGQLSKPDQIRKTRRSIARIQTLLGQMKRSK